MERLSTRTGVRPRLTRWMWQAAAISAVAVILTLTTGFSLQSGSMADPLNDICTDDEYEEDDVCFKWSYPYRYSELGTSESHRLCDPDYLHLEVERGVTYQVETLNLTGGADTVIEVFGYDKTWCGHRIIRDDDSGEGAASRARFLALPDWHDLVNILVAEANDEYADGKGYDIRVDEVQRSYLVPAVAHSAGAKSSFFKSDVQIFNPQTHAVTLGLALTPTGIDSAPQRSHQSIEVAAGALVLLEDIVMSVFGVEAVGSLEITTEGEQIVATCRTYNDAGSNGTFGQFIQAQELGAVSNDYYDGIALIHLGKSEEIRSNIGLCEVLGGETGVYLRLRGSTGSDLAEDHVILPPYGHIQINDIFSWFGIEAQENVRLVAQHDQGSGGFVSYASVLDNQSSDPIYVPGSHQADSYDELRLYVTAVASLDGAYDTQWLSDLRVLNLSRSVPRQVELTFLPRTDSASAEVSTSITIGAEETVSLTDVVGELGASGAGALAIEGENLLVTSRTFTRSEAGTHGQYIPARREEAAIGLGDGPLTALEAQRSAEYRTNVGWLNVSYGTGTLVVRLIDDQGIVLGSATYSLAARRPEQVNDIFDKLDVPWRTACRVELEVTEGTARILGYISVIDNRSGDPVYVPAEPIPTPG